MPFIEAVTTVFSVILSLTPSGEESSVFLYSFIFPPFKRWLRFSRVRLSHKQSRGSFIPGNAEPQLGSVISSKKHPITTNASVFMPLKRHFEKNQIQPTEAVSKAPIKPLTDAISVILSPTQSGEESISIS